MQPLLNYSKKLHRFAFNPIAKDADVTVLEGAVRSGKAQPLDAKILTPNGWKRMGDIRVGDEILSVDGMPTRVEAVFPQGQKEIFRMQFSDGASTECCAEHLWTTWTYAERSEFARAPHRLSAQPKVRTTREIGNSLRSQHLNAINHSIPIVKPVNFTPQSVSIDPYVMGILLGDGCFRKTGAVSFSSEDRQVIEYVGNNVPGCTVSYRSGYDDYDIVMVKSERTHCRRGHELSGKNNKIVRGRVQCRACVNSSKNASYARHRRDRRFAWKKKTKYQEPWSLITTSRHPIIAYLESVGLRGTFSSEKYIPPEYLFNTVEVRTQILRGLMDSDGSVTKNGMSVSFEQTSERLKDDVRFLVRSLGGTTSEAMKIPKFTYKGVRKTGKLCYRLRVSMPPGINPFNLKRKREKVRPKTSYRPVRYITSVESVGVKEAQCIKVSNPLQLYVTDDFIVTHNTWALIPKIVNGCAYKVGGLRLITGVSKQTIYNNILNDVFNILDGQDYSYDRNSGRLMLFGIPWQVMGAKDEGSEKYVRGSTVGLCIADEVTLMPHEFWNMLNTRLSPPGARLYATTNCDTPRHWLKTDVIDNKELLKSGKLQVIHCLLDDNPNIPEDYKTKVRMMYKGLFYQRYILARWVMAEGAIYRDAWSDELLYDDADMPVGLRGPGGHQDRWVAVDCGVDHPQIYLEAFDDGKTIWVDNRYGWNSKEEQQQKTDGQYADDLVNFMGKNNACQVLLPPEAASFRAELAMRGLWVSDANNEVNEGIKTVCALMNKRMIRFHRTRCAPTVKSIETYAWDPKASLRGEEKPLKIDDDDPDTLRYLVHGKVPRYRFC